MLIGRIFPVTVMASLKWPRLIVEMRILSLLTVWVEGDELLRQLGRSKAREATEAATTRKKAAPVAPAKREGRPGPIVLFILSLQPCQSPSASIPRIGSGQAESHSKKKKKEKRVVDQNF